MKFSVYSNVPQSLPDSNSINLFTTLLLLIYITFNLCKSYFKLVPVNESLTYHDLLFHRPSYS